MQHNGGKHTQTRVTTNRPPAGPSRSGSGQAHLCTNESDHRKRSVDHGHSGSSRQGLSASNRNLNASHRSLGLGLSLGLCTGLFFACSDQGNTLAGSHRLALSARISNSQGQDVSLVRFIVSQEGRAIQSEPIVLQAEALPSSPRATDHRVADWYVALAQGTYRLRAEPLTQEGKASARCLPATGTVTVTEEEALELILVSECIAAQSGAGDHAVTKNRSPHIAMLELSDDASICQDEHITMTATGLDSGADDVTWKWSVAAQPSGSDLSSYCLAASGPTAAFSSLVPGDYTLVVAAQTGAAPPTELRFPVVVAGCGADADHPGTAPLSAVPFPKATEGMCFCEDHVCGADGQCAEAAYCVRENGCFDEGLCAPRPRSCKDDGSLVCGCDGQTYPSACSAARSGVSVAAALPPKSCAGRELQPRTLTEDFEAYQTLTAVEDLDIPLATFSHNGTGRVHAINGMLEVREQGAALSIQYARGSAQAQFKITKLGNCDRMSRIDFFNGSARVRTIPLVGCPVNRAIDEFVLHDRLLITVETGTNVEAVQIDDLVLGFEVACVDACESDGADRPARCSGACQDEPTVMVDFERYVELTPFDEIDEPLMRFLSNGVGRIHAVDGHLEVREVDAVASVLYDQRVASTRFNFSKLGNCDQIIRIETFELGELKDSEVLMGCALDATFVQDQTHDRIDIIVQTGSNVEVLEIDNLVAEFDDTCEPDCTDEGCACTLTAESCGPGLTLDPEACQCICG